MNALAVTGHHRDVLALHAVELYHYLLALVVLRVKVDRLDSCSQVEVYHFKGSVEDVSHQVAGKVLTHHEIHLFVFEVLLESYVFVLFQQQRVLPAELQEDAFFCLSHELVQDLLAEVAVVEGEEESARHFSLEAFDIEAEQFFDFESDVCGQVVDNFAPFGLHQHLIGGKYWFLVA
jgi:hypothetical protein